jgi:hypothetical protein
METGAPTQPLEIAIIYDGASRRGSFRIEAPTINTIWDRLKQAASTTSNDARITDRLIELSWSGVLDILRDYGNRDSQRIFDFRFRPDAVAKEKIAEFTQARQIVRQAQGSLQLTITEAEIDERLEAVGFTERKLKWFQKRDLRRLLSMTNGANFSVPGAGKTTVTFALHLLASQTDQHALVVCPKAAFPAWADIVKECIAPGHANSLPFEVLSGNPQAVEARLPSTTSWIWSSSLKVGWSSTNPRQASGSHRRRALPGDECF